MKTNNKQRVLSVALALLLTIASAEMVNGFQTSPSIPSTDTANPTESASQTPEQLQALVSPIALYPDSLVAQILTASTYPDQVAIAAYWLEQNKNHRGDGWKPAL